MKSPSNIIAVILMVGLVICIAMTYYRTMVLKDFSVENFEAGAIKYN